MPFVFLLLFALVCLQTHWPDKPAWLESESCAMLVGTMVVASWLSAGLIARVLSWQMVRRPETRYAVLRRYSRWRRNHFIALIATYLAALYFLGWGHVLFQFLTATIPETYRSDENLPGFQLGLLAPFFLGLIASWERWYYVEKTAYELTHTDPYARKAPYLLMQIRHQFFIVLPPIFVMTALQILSLFLPGTDKNSLWPVLVIVGFLGLAFIAMPIVLRIFLGLKPLPPGELRDRLEATARRLRFGYSNVLVWPTRNLLANAMVTGFVPWIRYIILTDRLIEELTPAEIEAVFGHEVGHIKHHHLFFYLAFFMTSVILFSILWEQAAHWIRHDDIKDAFEHILDGDDLATLSGIGKLALLAPYMLVCFGFLSRRCERQADLYGAQTVSTDVFISALEKVADINGIPRDRFSWLHPSIAKRILFLEEMRNNPAQVPAFHLSLRLMQLALYGTLAVLLFLMWTYDLLDMWKLLQ